MPFRRFTVVLAAASCLLARPARAEDDAPDRAVLLQRAQEARDSGEHRTAFELGKRAGALRMTASLRRFLVEEEIALERFSAAYEDARRCIAEAALEPPSANHDAVLLGCKTHVQALRPRVALLRLEFAAHTPPDVVVAINGEAVAEPLEAAERPVTPGRVVIEAWLPRHRPWRSELSLRAGQVERVPIELVAEPTDRTVAPAPRQAAAPPGRAPREPHAPRVARGISGPLVAGGGLLLGAASLATRLVADGDYAALKRQCEVGGCPNGNEQRAHIDRLDTLALVTALTGAALVAGGATLYFWLDRPDGASARRTDAATVGIRSRF